MLPDASHSSKFNPKGGMRDGTLSRAISSEKLVLEQTWYLSLKQAVDDDTKYPQPHGTDPYMLTAEYRITQFSDQRDSLG